MKESFSMVKILFGFLLAKKTFFLEAAYVCDSNLKTKPQNLQALFLNVFESERNYK
jgi:hypothetical protein